MDNIIDKSTLIEFERLCQDNDVDTLIFYDDFPMESPEYKEIYEFAWRLNALDDYLRKGRTALALCVLSELEGYLISDFLFTLLDTPDKIPFSLAEEKALIRHNTVL